MRQFNNTEIQRMRYLTAKGFHLTYLQPTETGLTKSIMDATQIVRDYFELHEFHFYDEQLQGTSHKRIVTAFFVAHDGLVSTKASLYRPETKQGDPRIWFYELKSYAQPGDILAVHFSYAEQSLFIFNLTRTSIEELPGNMLPVPEIDPVNQTAQELLGKIRNAASNKLIPSVRHGDTGIGATLEGILGIPINSSKGPDYKGIEIKTHRATGRRQNTRQTLFARVPDWDISPLKSSTEILEHFGYFRDGKYRLNCTISAVDFNTQGLRFRVDESENTLVEYSNTSFGDVAKWRIEKLKKALRQKHSATFWVEAETVTQDDQEYFRFTSVVYTRSPYIEQTIPLLGQGIITMDHLISRRPEQASAHERGPLFKIGPQDMDLLFPPGETWMIQE